MNTIRMFISIFLLLVSQQIYLLKSYGSNFEQEVVFSTFLGGSTHDWIGGLCVDDTGNVYVTGPAYSKNFPVTKRTSCVTC